MTFYFDYEKQFNFLQINIHEIAWVKHLQFLMKWERYMLYNYNVSLFYERNVAEGGKKWKIR